MTTEERLEKLEREIEKMQTEIRTKKLCILDDQGKKRVELAVDKDGPKNYSCWMSLACPEPR